MLYKIPVLFLTQVLLPLLMILCGSTFGIFEIYELEKFDRRGKLFRHSRVIDSPFVPFCRFVIGYPDAVIFQKTDRNISCKKILPEPNNDFQIARESFQADLKTTPHQHTQHFKIVQVIFSNAFLQSLNLSALNPELRVMLPRNSILPNVSVPSIMT